MNKQRLQDIANNTRFVEDKDIVDIKQLIVHFPYYKLPYVVLAKIYFEKEHYLFENALTQAAMRVNDREWLYHYVHGEQTVTSQAKEEIQENGAEKTFEIAEPPVEIAPPAIEITEKEPLPAMELPKELSEPETNEQGVLNVPAEESERIELAVENIAAKNNLSEFLEDQKINDASEELENNTHQTEESVIDEAEPEIKGTSEQAEDETEILDTDKSEPQESGPEADSAINFAMNLRKHPVYNVEEFLQSDNQTEKPESKEEKDFFYWLQHPQPEHNEHLTGAEVSEVPEEKIENPVKDNKFSIIDEFIKANPGISRPKKEFFNAENMAKKSEQVDTDFVTETLANIYYEQGNTDLAVKAYEKLSLQNPLKQTYFATLIEKIKKEKK